MESIMPVSLTSEAIAIDRIKIDKKRKPDEEIVRQLMISIPLVGLLQPIVLCRPAPGLGINLVFGAARLEACKRLKWRSLIARVVNGNTDEIKAWCQRAALDENLIRHIHVVMADPNIISLIDARAARARA